MPDLLQGLLHIVLVYPESKSIVLYAHVYMIRLLIVMDPDIPPFHHSAAVLSSVSRCSSAREEEISWRPLAGVEETRSCHDC